jgi:hypothetical protein
MSKSRAVSKSSTAARRRQGTKVSNSRARQGGADRSLEFSLEEVIHLTPKGIELKHLLLKFALEVQDIATADISVEELETLRTVLRKMQAALLKDQAASRLFC